MDDKLKGKLSSIMQLHRGQLISESFEGPQAAGIFICDLSKPIMDIKVFSVGKADGRLYSFNFQVERSAKFRREGEKVQIETISELAAGLAPMPADWQIEPSVVTDYPAGEVISDLGLYSVTPGIGELSYERLLEKMRRELTLEEFSQLSTVLNKDAIVASESARIRSPLGLGHMNGKPVHHGAVKALQACPEFDWDHLLYYGRKDERGELRRQAAEVYPVLAQFFAENSLFSRRVIEKKKPLNAHLAEVFGIQEKSLKRLRGVSWPVNNIELSTLLTALDRIPPDWFPKNQEDWESFCILASSFDKHFSTTFEALGANPYEILFKGAKGEWREFHKRCVISFKDTRPPPGLGEELSERVKKETDWKALEKAASRSDSDYAAQVERELGKFGFPQEANRDAVRAWMLSVYDPDLSPEHLENMCFSTIEMAEFVRDKVTLPAAATAVQESGAMDEVFVGDRQMQDMTETTFRLMFLPNPSEPSGGKAAPNIFEATRYFLNDYAAIAEKVTNTSADRVDLSDIQEDEWAPLIAGDVFMPGSDIFFTSLSSTGELQEEGGRQPDKNGVEGLYHCVGGYTGQCQNSFQHIVSMRRAVKRVDASGNERDSYERLSTIQFLAIDDFSRGNAVDLDRRQFYAIRDTTPSPEMQEALRWFEGAASRGEVPLNLNMVQTYMEDKGEANLKKNDVQRRCIYNWSEKDAINNAMFAVGRVIHKGITKKVRNVDDLMAHSVMKEAVDSLDLVGSYATVPA